MKQAIIAWGLVLLLLIVGAFLYFSHHDSGKTSGVKTPSHSKEAKPKPKPKILWGVDSSKPATASLYQCVAKNLGKPEVWGRYLGSKQGISKGLTKSEAKFLHTKKIRIMVVDNHFTRAVSMEAGKRKAKEAVSMAQKVGLPKKTAIFADIEPKYPVDEAFLRGWAKALRDADYRPGVYGAYGNHSKLTEALNSAFKREPQLKKELVIWTNQPQKKAAAKKKAPKFNPYDKKGVLVVGWQYGIEETSCHVDTDLFSDGNVLWGP
ncbi:glycoside hydrolase domain-containing protein [Camelliibacillus cellulosilyticus]|uniref:Glycoside hydrolase domain-containing protein n=1 Tax=Camelliibacillus cellulosilyticus TaxID=2174486 RepID=A0ABV9GV23_9BACL